MQIKRKIISTDEAYLRQVSEDVDFNDKSYLDDIKVLEDYCLNNRVYALAPVQIGIPKRIIYLRNTSEDMMNNTDPNYNEAKVLINPIILRRTGHTRFLERCASCLDLVGLVDRPYIIDIEYYDVNGKKICETFKGFKSTVICHECDHLDGVLHIDLVPKIMEMSIEETKEYRDKNPYQVISEDCDFDKELQKMEYKK